MSNTLRKEYCKLIGLPDSKEIPVCCAYVLFLETQLGRAREGLSGIEEREAAVCPEDTPFDEYITALNKRIEKQNELISRMKTALTDAINWAEERKKINGYILEEWYLPAKSAMEYEERNKQMTETPITMNMFPNLEDYWKTRAMRAEEALEKKEEALKGRETVIAELREVLEASCCTPGRHWFHVKLAMGEFLSGKTGANFEWMMKEYAEFKKSGPKEESES